jgi:hypothetical protein
MPYKDKETRRLADKARYDLKRASILEQKRERQKSPEFKANRRAYLKRAEVVDRRRGRDSQRYQSDSDYCERKKARAKARRSTPEGRAENIKAAAKWRSENPGKNYEAVQRWRSENRERYNRVSGQRHKERYAAEPGYRIMCNMRRRLNLALRKQSTVKCSTTMKLVGCSTEDLVSHLESQFSAGMSWANYGEWHVDHVRELCEFDLTVPEQQQAAFHYTNLRPLWAKVNLQRPNRSKPTAEEAKSWAA